MLFQASSQIFFSPQIKSVKPAGVQKSVYLLFVSTNFICFLCNQQAATSIAEKSALWLKKRDERLNEERRRKEETALDGCTFEPCLPRRRPTSRKSVGVVVPSAASREDGGGHKRAASILDVDAGSTAAVSAGFDDVYEVPAGKYASIMNQ